MSKSERGSDTRQSKSEWGKMTIHYSVYPSFPIMCRCLDFIDIILSNETKEKMLKSFLNPELGAPYND